MSALFHVFFHSVLCENNQLHWSTHKLNLAALANYQRRYLALKVMNYLSDVISEANVTSPMQLDSVVYL